MCNDKISITCSINDEKGLMVIKLFFIKQHLCPHFPSKPKIPNIFKNRKNQNQNGNIFENINLKNILEFL